ncbi:type I restriction enzyme S subunit [Pseudomonas koreensis]|uniref:restriction endonuclease subunit S n=1 Tax=Pseudomonas koreensis TaxID=198620 RepID=UPI002854A1DC|nr:restriction endonuclease subunit S [Pseudomonas koreensis]MDR7056804.1 type I restriction enzyme S subunit [Pseudomonas koreensis]
MAVKPGYKQTEVGIIPEDWELVTLESVAKIIDPQPDHRTPPEASGGEPYIGISDFLDQNTVNWDTSRKIIAKAVDKQQSSFRIRSGDIIFGKIGTIGLPKYAPITPFRYALSANVLLVQPTIEPHFVMSWLRSRTCEKAIIGELHSTSQAAFGINKMRRLGIPVPPEPEQRAIALALSDVDALMGALERLIAKKRDLKQAAMQQLLSGKTRLPGFYGERGAKRLGDMGEIVMGQSPSSSNYNSQGDGLPLIQGNADIANRKTIKRVFTTQITKRGLAGDILLSVRAPVGEVSRATFDLCLGRGVCAIRYPNDFLYHYLIFLEPMWAKHSKGSTFESVNSTDVRAVEIQLPSDVSEQIAIAAILSDMDTELAALEQRLAKTRTLKQGMTQELLTGRTRLL